ncbi:MAG: DUF333 domain-containing protein, partial [candidate division Zixibacteria bacterium]|nr:DUF333 domain-containing protein [candidate division Zixibacteria bacterium]
MRKALLFIALLMIFCFSATAFCADDWLFLAKIDHHNSGGIGVANPAAIYCRELGYQYNIVNGPKGQCDVCTFPNGTSADAWDFLKGKVAQEFSYCALNDYQIKTLSDGGSSISLEYAVCIDKNDAVVGSVEELSSIIDIAVKGSMYTTAKRSQDPQPIQTPERAIDIPPVFDWRDQHGEFWITPVKNQGGCGSCWAFASIGLVEGTRNIHQNDPNIDIDLSEQYINTDCLFDQNCCGGFNDIALDFIKNDGVPDDACMIYYDGGGCSCIGSTCQPDCNHNLSSNCSDYVCGDRCADWESRLDYVADWQDLGEFNYTAIKQYIATNGPVAVYIGIGDDF